MQKKMSEEGYVCPQPLFYTKRNIEEMLAGEELEVIEDDPAAKETIPRWSRSMGMRF